MTGYSDFVLWALIAALALGTFAIRFSFLGLLGRRQLPPNLLRLLRYTPVTVLPALIAPLILWPAETAGTPDPLRLAAAAVTLAVGMITKRLLWAFGAGIAAFAVGQGLGLGATLP